MEDRLEPLLVALPKARSHVNLAAAVEGAPGSVRDAVADGDVSLEQAEVIVKAIEALPREAEVRELAAKELVRLAEEFEPSELKTAGGTILRVVDPDAADEVERKALERAEATAGERRSFTLTPGRGGFGIRVSGLLTNEGAAIVRAAIDPLCNPARTTTSDGPMPRRRPRRGVSARPEHHPTSPQRRRPAPGRGQHRLRRPPPAPLVGGWPDVAAERGPVVRVPPHRDPPAGWLDHGFVPPRHVDPEQKSCRNRYHRRQ